MLISIRWLQQIQADWWQPAHRPRQKDYRIHQGNWNAVATNSRKWAIWNHWRPGQIFGDLVGSGQGYHHDIRFCLLGNFEHTGAEGMELAVLAGVAFRENTQGALILFDQGNAFENGLQGNAVIFTVNKETIKFMHCLGNKWCRWFWSCKYD